jgi:hypothetical protein
MSSSLKFFNVTEIVPPPAVDSNRVRQLSTARTLRNSIECVKYMQADMHLRLCSKLVNNIVRL